MHAVFDQRFVRVPAQAVLAADDVGQVMRDLHFRDQQAAGASEGVALALAAPGDDHDSVTAAPLRGLDHEAVVVGDDFGEAPDVALVVDDAVEVGHGHSGFQRQLLREGLVVDTRVQPPGIQAHDEVGIAFVKAQYTGLAHFSGCCEHQLLVRALNRPSSRSR